MFNSIINFFMAIILFILSLFGLGKGNGNSGNTEPPFDGAEICENCGNYIVLDNYTGNTVVGDYCDGQCNQWNGDFEI